jgi:RNA polymerase sigma-70 factor (ECF subfamily)
MEGRAETNSHSRVLYCVIPRELAPRLHDLLRRHFRDDPSVEVVVERRDADRRRGDRRVAEGERKLERRRIRAVEGRRVSDRRVPVVGIEPPELPRRARVHAAELLFVERIEPSRQHAEDLETARLVTRIQAGDQEAFGDLYLRYFDRVYGYIRVAIGDRHEAEDLTQQVFERALGGLARYQRRAGTPFRAWLFRIARNAVVDASAEQKRVRPEAPADLDQRLEGATPARDQLTDTLSWLSDREVAMFVGRLPEAQRQVLVLRYMLDLSSEEIANLLDRTPGAVRKLNSRALRLLEAHLTAVGRAPTRRARRVPSLIRLRHPRVLVERRFALLGSGPKPSQRPPRAR